MTEPFYFYTEYLGSNMIDFSSASRENVVVDGIMVTKYTSNQWVQFDPSSNPLSYS